MSRLDQMLQVGIGLGLMALGLLDNWLITDPVVGAIIAVIGAVNTTCALIGFCPVYRFAEINTCPADIQRVASSKDLRLRKLLATIALSVFGLSLFGVVAYRIADEVAGSRTAPTPAARISAFAAGLNPAQQTPALQQTIGSTHVVLRDGLGEPIAVPASVGKTLQQALVHKAGAHKAGAHQRHSYNHPFGCRFLRRLPRWPTTWFTATSPPWRVKPLP